MLRGESYVGADVDIDWFWCWEVGLSGGAIGRLVMEGKVVLLMLNGGVPCR